MHRVGYRFAGAVHGLPRHAPPEQRAAALRLEDPALPVVHTRPRRGDHGYRLDYRLLAATGGSGTVQAADPIRLGRALARRLRVHLLPGQPPDTDGFASHEPWAMQLFARALRLLRVVLDLEPDYLEAQRELERLEAAAPV